MRTSSPASRRKFLRGCTLGAGGAVVLHGLNKAWACMECLRDKLGGKYPIGNTMLVGNTVVPSDASGSASLASIASVNGSPTSGAGAVSPAGAMNPMTYLRAFDWGQLGSSSSAQPQREYVLRAEDVDVEVATGIKFPAWTYNGQFPGPTLRANAGDRLLIHFENRGSR